MVAALLVYLAEAPVINANLAGGDAHAYWLSGRNEHLYGLAPGARNAFLYSPAFAQAIWPLAQLPWPIFLAIWLGAQLAIFAWLLAPLGWPWAVPLIILCIPAIEQGGIYGLMAACAIIGMRHPAAWAFILLTKITPGLGVVWFAVRREWRSLGVLLSATSAIVLVSFAIAPRAWSAWLHFLLNSGGESSIWLYVRVISAVVITAFGAYVGKPWLLAPAMWLASPVLIVIVGYSLLAALPRLLAASPRGRSSTGAMPGGTGSTPSGSLPLPTNQ